MRTHAIDGNEKTLDLVDAMSNSIKGLNSAGIDDIVIISEIKKWKSLIGQENCVGGVKFNQRSQLRWNRRYRYYFRDKKMKKSHRPRKLGLGRVVSVDFIIQELKWCGGRAPEARPPSPFTYRVA